MANMLRVKKHWQKNSKIVWSSCVFRLYLLLYIL